MSRRLELVELLAGFAATEAERRDLAAMRDLAMTPHDVLSATWYEPGHFTVSAFITDAAMSSVVLIHHRKLGMWLQPGGHVEPADASLIATLRREVEEETGIVTLSPARPALFDVDVHSIPTRGAQPSHLHFDLRFHVFAPREALAPSDEVLGAAWVDLAEVGAWTEDRSVRRAVAKLERHRRQIAP